MVVIAPCDSLGGGVPGGVDLGDDAAGVRLDHLRAVAEIDFVAVVMRRVVARGHDHAGDGAQVAHGEGELRGGARAVEDAGVAAVPGRDLGREAGEIGGEKTGVMRDDDFRPAAPAFALATTRSRYSAKPWVARATLSKFIAFVPTQGYCGRPRSLGVPRSAAVTILPMVRPRIPPVPKASER